MLRLSRQQYSHPLPSTTSSLISSESQTTQQQQDQQRWHGGGAHRNGISPTRKYSGLTQKGIISGSDPQTRLAETYFRPSKQNKRSTQVHIDPRRTSNPPEAKRKWPRTPARRKKKHQTSFARKRQTETRETITAGTTRRQAGEKEKAERLSLSTIDAGKKEQTRNLGLPTPTLPHLRRYSWSTFVRRRRGHSRGHRTAQHHHRTAPHRAQPSPLPALLSPHNIHPGSEKAAGLGQLVERKGKREPDIGCQK